MEDDSGNNDATKRNNCSVKGVYHRKTVVRLFIAYSDENG